MIQNGQCQNHLRRIHLRSRSVPVLASHQYHDPNPQDLHQIRLLNRHEPAASPELLQRAVPSAQQPLVDGRLRGDLVADVVRVLVFPDDFHLSLFLRNDRISHHPEIPTRFGSKLFLNDLRRGESSYFCFLLDLLNEQACVGADHGWRHPHRFEALDQGLQFRTQIPLHPHSLPRHRNLLRKEPLSLRSEHPHRWTILNLNPHSTLPLRK